MAKLVLLYLILLKVAVSKNLSMTLSEDLLYPLSPTLFSEDSS